MTEYSIRKKNISYIKMEVIERESLKDVVYEGLLHGLLKRDDGKYFVLVDSQDKIILLNSIFFDVLKIEIQRKFDKNYIIFCKEKEDQEKAIKVVDDVIKEASDQGLQLDNDSCMLDVTKFTELPKEETAEKETSNNNIYGNNRSQYPQQTGYLPNNKSNHGLANNNQNYVYNTKPVNYSNHTKSIPREKTKVIRRLKFERRPSEKELKILLTKIRDENYKSPFLPKKEDKEEEKEFEAYDGFCY